MSYRRTRLGVPIAAIGIFAAACSGGVTVSATDAPTTARPTPTVEFNPLPTATSSTTTSTEAPTTTTEPDATTTTTEPLGPVAQLTGMQVDEELTHPALVVKIDNHTDARPQWGLNAADVIYEEIVEGNITRFAAVFHSTASVPVGPVRSARTSDFDILNALNTPLFANSGGNSTVLRLLRSVDSVNANVNALPELFYRERTRSAPHNLLTSTADLIDAKGAQGGAPPVLFEYRRGEDELPESAIAIEGVDIAYGGHSVSFDWDPSLKGWARTQNTIPHVDADGVRVAPANVVVQFINYGRSQADPTSPHALLVGDGTAWFLVDGHQIEGLWSRGSAAETTTYTLTDGTPVKLDPGQSWVALPRIDQAEIRE